MISYYDVVFTRYKDHERRRSSVVSMRARDFDGAVELAHAYLRGARAADPSADFEIVAIVTPGVGGEIAVLGWHLQKEIGDGPDGT